MSFRSFRDCSSRESNSVEVGTCGAASEDAMLMFGFRDVGRVVESNALRVRRRNFCLFTLLSL